jgi:hypothetical protein
MLKIIPVLVLAMGLVAGAMVFQTTAADQPVTQMFDRNACYSNCPCGMVGSEQICLDCREKCDERFWKEFDAETEDDN